LILALMVVALPAQSTLATSPNVVISQVYGGGGNSGAPLTNDYIELFNRGTSTISLAGWSVQYASATGTGNFGANSGQITELSGSLAVGQYMLVEEASGTSCSGLPCGSSLPTPDVTDSSPINMSASGAKVALVNTITPLGCNGYSTPCSPAALATIVDLVGWGSANFYEGSRAGPATSNTTAAFRASGGCQDTDDNFADFSEAAPDPRNTGSPLNTCPSDFPPSVSSTTPADGDTSIDLNSNITINFSEAVNVADGWFTISCATSGSHTAVVTGGPTDFTLNPDVDFAMNETCTVTVLASQVTDQDLIDPPDEMAADYVFSFTTLGPPTFIHDIQGASHISPMNGDLVTNVNGIVTAKTTNGFYMEDPNPDSNDATSEGIFVYTSSAPPVNVGDAVRVGGTVQEFRPGGSGGLTNLTTTEIGTPGRTVTVLSSGNPLPAPVIIGTGGRIPPSTVIEDDATATGNVETSGVFDPANDGIDFYESLEGMLVQVNDAVATGPWHNFGSNREIPVVGDNGANASVRTPRGGVVIQANDYNPERIILNDLIAGGPTLPPVNVGDSFPGATLGVIDYNFGNFKLEVTSLPAPFSSDLTQEVTSAADSDHLAVATFNVENLAPTDPQSKFDTLAQLILNHLQAPDVIAIEEIQDDNGITDDGTVNASTTWDELIAAIQAAGGPAYQYRQIDPVNDEDGGAPGGNIRQGFLFRTDRGLNFIDRPGASSTTDNVVVGSGTGTQLQYSPGRIKPTDTAFYDSRKPLAAEFMFRGRHLFVIANHFNSKGGDDPLFGRFQPPVFSSEVQRDQQAQIVHDFVQSITNADPNADVVVLGDLNDYQFSNPIKILTGENVSSVILNDLINTLPIAERYSYVYDGNSEVLDHSLLSNNLFGTPFTYDVVHVNSEFAVQASDHEPQVMQLLTYMFSGFFPPLANPPTFNAVKAGQSVPVKFSLNGDKGLNIFAAGYPQSTMIVCDTSISQDAIEETDTAGSSSLSYDPTTDTYNYVWKTDKGWAGTCRQLVVKLDDGTFHYADFSFTK
jgi:predicted extracellular nuclease